MADDTSCDLHAERKGQGRSLSYYERFSASLSGMRAYAIYWHAAVINTSRALKDDDVVTACKILARKQEVLQMCIVPTDQVSQSVWQFRFIPMKDPEKIDFESTIINSKDDWPTLTSKYHNEHKIDIVNGPLWRIILARVLASDESFTGVQQYVILLKFIHTFVDGLSVFDLLNRQFLPILSELINGKDGENIIPFLPQTKSLEDMFPQAHAPFSCFTKLQLDLLRWKHRTFKSTQHPVYLFPDEIPPFSAETVKEAPCIPKIFGEDICVSVIAAAKKHGVTVHSVLLSAGALALARTAKRAGVKLPGSFKQAWPISLRKHLDFKTPQPLGYFGSDGTTIHESVTDYTRTMEKFWESCEKLQKHVQQESTLDKCINHIRGFQYLVNAAQKSDLVTVLSEMGSPPNLFLSNLGNTDAVKPHQRNANRNPKVNMTVDVTPDADSKAGINTDEDLKADLTTDDDRFTNADSCVNTVAGITIAVSETEIATENTDTTARSAINITEETVAVKVTEQYFHLTGLAEANCSPLAQFMLTFENRFMWNIRYNPRTVSKRFVEAYLIDLEHVFKTFCTDKENANCVLTKENTK